jgi:hypothetical protein
MAIFSTLAGIGSSVIAAVGYSGAVAYGSAVLVGALAYGAVGYATNALFAPRTPVGSNRGYRVTTSGSATDIQIIYGKARTGGVRVYRNDRDSSTSHLWDVIVLAAHECEEISDVYVGDYRVVTYAATNTGPIDTSLTEGWVRGCEDADGNFSQPFRRDGVSKLQIRKHLGTYNQEADPEMVSEMAEWTTAHQLRGLCYMAVLYVYDSNAYASGLPAMSAVVKGKKVYDPRTGNTEWSDNPALCIADYLENDYGLDEDRDQINMTAVSVQANVCDRTASNGEKFFTCNGAFVTSAQPHDIIIDLLTSMGGSTWYTEGQWHMKASYWTEPVLSLDEDDLRSDVLISTRHSRRDNFNIVRGLYQGPETNWQPTEYTEINQMEYSDTAVGVDAMVADQNHQISFLGTTDWNIVCGTSGVTYTTSSNNYIIPTAGGLALEAGTTGLAYPGKGRYIAEDNDQELPIDFDLPFTNNGDEAARIANIFLERNRNQLTIQTKLGLRAFELRVGDVVQLSISRFSWVNKTFEVAAWTFGQQQDGDLQVDVVLREIEESVFDEVDSGPSWVS